MNFFNVILYHYLGLKFHIIWPESFVDMCEPIFSRDFLPAKNDQWSKSYANCAISQTKMEFFETMPSSKTILTAATSLTASVILFRSIASDLVPEQLQLFFSSRFQKLSNRLSSQLTVVIEESEGLTSNQMFGAVKVYLGTKVNDWTRRIKVNKPDEDEELAVTVDR